MTRILRPILLVLALATSFTWAAGADDYFNAGTYYLRQGQYAKAIPYFKATLSLNPNHALAYEGVAQCYYNTRQYDAAYDACQKGLVVYPESTILHSTMDKLGPLMARPPLPEAHPAGKVVSHGRVIKEGPMLAPQFTIKAALKTDYSMESEFNKGIDGWKAAAPSFGATIFDASSGNLGFGAKLDLDYNFDAWSAISMAFAAWGEDGFHGHASDSAGATLTSDFNPLVTSVEMDYCHFWPHDDYRFYVKGGFGYYYCFMYASQYQQNGILGPMMDLGKSPILLGSGDFGLNLGAGYELRLEDNLGLELSVLLRLATISQFTYSDPNSHQALGLTDMSNGFIAIEDTNNINSTTGDKFFTMDLTGAEIGISVDYYLF